MGAVTSASAVSPVAVSHDDHNETNFAAIGGGDGDGFFVPPPPSFPSDLCHPSLSSSLSATSDTSTGTGKPATMPTRVMRGPLLESRDDGGLSSKGAKSDKENRWRNASVGGSKRKAAHQDPAITEREQKKAKKAKSKEESTNITGNSKASTDTTASTIDAVDTADATAPLPIVQDYIGDDDHYHCCSACGIGGDVALCGACPLVWHPDCLPIASLRKLQKDDWKCPKCMDGSGTAGTTSTTRSADPQPPTNVPESKAKGGKAETKTEAESQELPPQLSPIAQRDLVRQVQVGGTISIYWSGDRTSYPAVVMRWRRIRGRTLYRLLYEDGFVEHEVDLMKERFVIVKASRETPIPSGCVYV